MILKGYGSVIPDAPRAKSHILTKWVGDKVGRLVAEYVKAMEKVRGISALFWVMAILVLVLFVLII